MRVWIGVGLAVLVGIGAGWGVARARMSRHPWTRSVAGDAAPVRDLASAATAGAKALPKVVVEKDSYDFGSMEAFTSQQHEFVFTNQGAGPLKLTKGETSCKCAAAKVDEMEISQGGSTRVGVQWTAQGPTDEFRHSATILTNDPSRPRVALTITGRVTAVVRASPARLGFGRLSVGEEAAASVRLYGYAAKRNVEVYGCRFEDTGNAKYFGVALKALPADQLKDELGATSGVEARITVKPGLPVGPFRQRLSIITNLQAATAVEVPIDGDIVSEIAVAGREFDPQTGVLMLGTVRSSQGAEQTVRILVRGPYCKDVKFEAQEVVPRLLHVQIGETAETSSGTVTLTPVIIQIPKGSPPANYLGSDHGNLGRVTLKTRHPHQPELRIYVRFAVEG